MQKYVNSILRGSFSINKMLKYGGRHLKLHLTFIIILLTHGS